MSRRATTVLRLAPAVSLASLVALLLVAVGAARRPPLTATDLGTLGGTSTAGDTAYHATLWG
jgi:hypothetical protein